MNIGTNAVYAKYNGSETSFVYAFSIHPLSMTNPAMCERHKRWLNSIKKYSTLITKSNEMLQSEYFDKQREYVHSLDSGDLVPLY
ncbi:hypothetical protein FACS189446_1430 [Bacteroidia bacterium]|nr:hypothetical protein FACS189446_1430 [Bacteroidia bacterium]